MGKVIHWLLLIPLFAMGVCALGASAFMIGQTVFTNPTSLIALWLSVSLVYAFVYLAARND